MKAPRGAPGPLTGASLPAAKAPITLGDRIGEGTLSEVYRAAQPGLGRDVAVKVLKGSVAPTSQLGRRFSREATLLAGFAHQNVPQVHDAGVTDDGRPFIVMELVEGWTLAELRRRCEGGSLPPDVAAVVALKIGRALEYAHLRGVLHRDLKPGNVLVSRLGDVKLADFGLAEVVDEPDAGLGVVGTPAYMSPEQVLGDRLDFRSDIFSFGIVLYELLTGRRPFEEDPGRTVMQKIRLDRYTPAGRLRAGVPATLERVLARCLEKRPSHRYGSTGALCDDLNEHLARRGVASHEARLVAWLQSLAVIDDVAAREALGPAGGEWGRSPSGRPTLRRVVIAQVAAGALSLGAMGALEAMRGREHEPTSALGPRPQGTAGVGFLRVLARPWAEVVVDGYSVDTTPSSRPVPLAPGTHYVRLRNPSFVTEDRAVQIASGATVWIDVDLQPASGGRRVEE